MKNKVLATVLLLCYASYGITSTVFAGARYGKPTDFNGGRSGGMGKLIFTFIVVAGIVGIIGEIGKRKGGN